MTIESGADGPKDSTKSDASNSPEAKPSGDLVSRPKDPSAGSPIVDGVPSIQGLPSSKDYLVTTAVSNTQGETFAASYEGVLPPPAILEGYERIVPGSAKEIMAWVSDESKHRRTLELEEAKHRRLLEKKESEHRIELENRALDLGKRSLESGIFRANVGMFLAWPLCIGVLIAGAYLISIGHDWAGFALAESSLALIVGSYILGRIEDLKRRDRDDDDEDKDAEGRSG